MLCLTEVLRVGTPDERAQARRHAEAALLLLQDSRLTYTLPRAEYAVAMGAAAQGNIAEAADLFARSLDSARRGGNRILEPLLLMNLGVAQARLGNPADAAGFYRDSSRLYEALGDERRAAQQQANSAALQIDYGEEPAAALRDVQNALAVFEKLGDRNFEAFCRQVIAAYYRHTGHYREAERELGRAMAILRERNLEDDIASLTLDRARLAIETANYAAAIRLLEETVREDGPYSTPARIHLARARSRAGDGAGARAALSAVSADVGEGSELLALLLLVSAEVAAEAGRLDEARALFGRSATLWTAQMPDVASVEARAEAGFLDAQRGHPGGRAAIQSSLEQARNMERPALEARCRLLLARLDLAGRRFAEAMRALDGIPPDEGGRLLGPELRAQVQFWRAAALAGLGRDADAQRERAAAREVIDGLRASLPEPDRARFAARPDIRRILG